MLIGTGGISVVNFGFTIVLITYHFSEPSYDPMTICLILFFEYLFYSISIFTLSFTYTAETLTERGFALAVTFYWLISAIIVVSFLLFAWKLPAHYIDDVHMYYMLFFTIMSVIVYLLCIIDNYFCETGDC